MAGAGTDIPFLHAPCIQPLPIPPAGFDLLNLLNLLFAGPVWERCRHYLSLQGPLPANTSHGDASLAALEPALQLIAVVYQRADKYRLDIANLENNLIPKRPSTADPDTIRRQGRGIAYMKTAFAYVLKVVGNPR